MKRKSLLIAAVLASFVFVGSAQACSKCSGKSWGKNDSKAEKVKEMTMFLFSNKYEIGITEDQWDKIADIKKSTLKKMIDIQANVDKVKIDIKSELWESSIDVKKVNGLIDQKYDGKKKLAKLYVQAKADMKSVLTDEQKDKVMAIYAQSSKKGACPYASKGKCAKKDCPGCAKCAKAKICPMGKDCKGKDCSMCAKMRAMCPMGDECPGPDCPVCAKMKGSMKGSDKGSMKGFGKGSMKGSGAE